MAAAGFSTSFLWSISSSRFDSSVFGLPPALFSLLLLLLLVEGGLKLLFLQAIAPMKHIPVGPERWSDSVQNQLAYYTEQLERLGFVLLTDYTFTTSTEEKASPSTVRLFVHPQKRVFAELGKVNDIPMHCSMASFLVDGWDVAVTNVVGTRSLAAISHAFLRLPRTIIIKREDALLNKLFQEALSLQNQVSKELGMPVEESIEAALYFERDRVRCTLQTAYNQIANYALTQSEINIQISDTNPKDYFARLAQQCVEKQSVYGAIIDKTEMQQNLAANCIPAYMLEGAVPDYESFLRDRRKLMAQKIKGYYESL